MTDEERNRLKQTVEDFLAMGYTDEWAWKLAKQLVLNK